MWCVLVRESDQMAGSVSVLGPYRSFDRASDVASRINRKIEIHEPVMADDWELQGGEPAAWVMPMLTKVTPVYGHLGIRRLP